MIEDIEFLKREVESWRVQAQLANERANELHQRLITLVDDIEYAITLAREDRAISAVEWLTSMKRRLTGASDSTNMKHEGDKKPLSDWHAEAIRRFGPVPEGGGENARLIASCHYAFIEGAKAADDPYRYFDGASFKEDKK